MARVPDTLAKIKHFADELWLFGIYKNDEDILNLFRNFCVIRN